MKDRLLILGISGSLGHTLFYKALSDDRYEVFGTLRNNIHLFDSHLIAKEQIFSSVDLENSLDRLLRVFETVQPTIVVNCIGIIKQQKGGENEFLCNSINTDFPHSLEQLCQIFTCKLIHISTDCVFDGLSGNYREIDTPSAIDVYGMSKLKGEVSKQSLTLRTSFIGHELWGSHLSLLEWFLSQNNSVKGFCRAYFSGTTTLELSNIILDIIIPQKIFSGLMHVGGYKIDKYTLLKIIAQYYDKHIKIVKDECFTIDRSLNQEVFMKKTGYAPQKWTQLIQELYLDYHAKKELGIYR